MKKLTAQAIALQFVEDIPGEYINRLTNLLQKETAFDPSRILHRLQVFIPQVDVQERIRSFVEHWARVEDCPSPREMAMMISAIDGALEYQSQKQSIELTWTGPKARNIHLRRTDQALLELISLSKHRITIVSFAVYRAKAIMAALEQAASRGVEIDIIIESPDASDGKIAYDTIAALGSGVKSKARIFIWPYAKREVSPTGKYGALHAKVAIGDDEVLYISSANLTEYAMNLNMEMGILVFGGELPTQARDHFEQLIESGILAEIAGG